MSNNKSYRVRFKENEDHVDINLNINQDIDMLEVLSLKVSSENLYKLQTSNYGCIAGRVLANNAVGVPNVRISIFISADESTKADSVLSSLYPYENMYDKNSRGVQYNLLTEEELTNCYQPVGTFPSKRMVLDDSNVFEIFDKYYKFTTTTNFAGDYMIFGVPTGSQILHMDVDLSDIGTLLSQTPRDFIYKGYDKNLFESPTQFKKSTDISSLPQIISQNEGVYVYPFWGDPSEMKENNSTGVRITRKDINLNYKFEPTCIFFGSLISDEKSNGISERCVPTDRMGKMDRITTGEGTIEMIRKTPDGDVESYNISGTHLIDGDGTWCYQIPMNLDFVRTDENGNIVPSDDPNKGFPTRTRVRFRFSLNDFASDYENNHLCKMLVPNNPTDYKEADNSFVFGSLTQESDFRDLLWNKVYTIKSYVPRIQKNMWWNREKRFTGYKAVNVNGSNNPLPYNNMRANITFMFVLQCAIIHTLIWITGVYNLVMIRLVDFIAGTNSCDGELEDRKKDFTCLTVGDGACPDLEGWYFAPNCKKQNPNNNPKIPFFDNTIDTIYNKLNGTDGTVDKKSIDYENRNDNEKVCLSNKIDYFIKCVEMSLAQEYEVIQFDFYNDWINGLLYIPRWFASIRKKRSYLFGLIKTPERVLGCLQDSFNIKRKYVQQCGLKYEISKPQTDITAVKIRTTYGCDDGGGYRCHRNAGRKWVSIFNKGVWNPGGGIVHSEETLKQEHVYYFRPRDFQHGYKGVTFFATDIVLLGSIAENDIDGVPKVTELISSTYQMPTNLAATNMDSVGMMLGAYSNNGVFKCKEDNIPVSQSDHHKGRVGLFDVDVADDTFEGTAEWEQYSSYEKDTNDTNEYPLTESSGIDWGYTGPEQKEIDFSNYEPGGHFLGLSCFNSETNIKTCVNLTRICEIGVSMSRRKTVEKLNDSENDMFVVPNGIINNYDIYDGDFRSVFATLNHNELKTKKDSLNGRMVYDFIPMHLSGFEGAFPKSYNSKKEIEYEDASGTKRRVVFSNNAEFFDSDYYNFRLGLNNFKNRELGNIYGIVSDGYYSLPMYNNSFYFYFGLHNGATALDKFYEKFYGSCVINENIPLFVTIDTEDAKTCFCEEYNNGKANVQINSVTNMLICYIYKKDGTLITSFENKFNFIVTGLSAGDYYLTIEYDGGVKKTGFSINKAHSYSTCGVLEPEFVNFKQQPPQERDIKPLTGNTEELVRQGGYVVIRTAGFPFSLEGLNISKMILGNEEEPISEASGSTYFSNNTIYFPVTEDGSYTFIIKYTCEGVSKEYTFNGYIGRGHD